MYLREVSVCLLSALPRGSYRWQSCLPRPSHLKADPAHFPQPLHVCPVLRPPTSWVTLQELGLLPYVPVSVVLGIPEPSAGSARGFGSAEGKGCSLALLPALGPGWPTWSRLSCCKDAPWHNMNTLNTFSLDKVIFGSLVCVFNCSPLLIVHPFCQSADLLTGEHYHVRCVFVLLNREQFKS